MRFINVAEQHQVDLIFSFQDTFSTTILIFSCDTDIVLGRIVLFYGDYLHIRHLFQVVWLFSFVGGC